MSNTIVFFFVHCPVVPVDDCLHYLWYEADFVKVDLYAVLNFDLSSMDFDWRL